MRSFGSSDGECELLEAGRGLDVQNELVLGLAEHEDADAEHDDRPNDA